MLNLPRRRSGLRANVEGGHEFLSIILHNIIFRYNHLVWVPNLGDKLVALNSRQRVRINSVKQCRFVVHNILG